MRLSIVLGAYILASLFFLPSCSKVELKASLKNLQGDVQTRAADENDFSLAKEGITVGNGGAIKTGEDGRVSIVFVDNSRLDLKPETFFELDKKSISGHQNSGTILYKIQKQKSGLEIRTPHGLTTVLGTTFLIIVGEESTIVGVEEGKVSFDPVKGARVELKSGEKQVFSSTGTKEKPQPFDLDTELFNFQKIGGKWVPQKQGK